MLWGRERRDWPSTVETGPAGGSCSSTTGPGVKGVRPSFGSGGRAAGTSNGGRCPLLREGVSDGAPRSW